MPFNTLALKTSALTRDPRAPVRAWLVLLCGMIFVMVLLGGATRLTDSGLSMVDWQPLHLLPPLTEAQWGEVFARYQTSPQYRLRNAGMTLSEFQGIFWLEYVHRLWGRLIGAAVLLPLLVFGLRRVLDAALARRMALLFVLGGAQGGLGWFMVRSGLVEQPEVSPYRLAAHLGLAVVLYAALVWTALTWRRPAAPGWYASARAPMALAGLVGLTMLSGAFVAGLDAGLTYNTFPLMDGRLVPSGLGLLDPWPRNLFENVTTVQFNHRLLAITTLSAALGLRWHLRALTGPARRAADAVALLALVQAGLGISTLLLVVPVPLAVAHQGGALALLTAILWLIAARRAASGPTAAAS